MTQRAQTDPHGDLPEGVRLVRADGAEPVELTIRAADADQLAWRIHDLIPLIQSGRLKRMVGGQSSNGARPGGPGT